MVFVNYNYFTVCSVPQIRVTVVEELGGYKTIFPEEPAECEYNFQYGSGKWNLHYVISRQTATEDLRGTRNR